MNKIKELTVRNVFPLEYFKSIRFRIEFPKKMIGNLVYLREHYEGYNPTKGDSIDSSLLSLLESSFDGIHRGYETVLIVEEQLEDALKVTQGGIDKKVVFYFMPHPTYELYEKHKYDGRIKAIPKELRISLMTNDTDSVNHAIRNEYMSYINIDDIIRVKTIKQV